jgi:hypothetical protein
MVLVLMLLLLVLMQSNHVPLPSSPLYPWDTVLLLVLVLQPLPRSSRWRMTGAAPGHSAAMNL